MRLWYLSHRRPAKAQASLPIRAVSPEPSLFAHIKYGSRRRVRPKIRHLAPTGSLGMRVWRRSLRRTKSTINSWDGNVSVSPSHLINWAASSEFGTYRLCEQRRFRRACASTQSRQNLRCSRIQAVSQEEPSDRKADPWPLWMAGHAQLEFVMTECSKTQIRLTGLNYCQLSAYCVSSENGHASCNWNKIHFSSMHKRNLDVKA